MSQGNGRQAAHTPAEPVTLVQAQENYRAGRHAQAVSDLESWLAQADRDEEAREQWELVRSLTPADAPQQVELHARIGDMYLAQNLTGPAAAEFKAGLQLDPDDQHLSDQLEALGL